MSFVFFLFWWEERTIVFPVWCAWGVNFVLSCCLTSYHDGCSEETSEDCCCWRWICWKDLHDLVLLEEPVSKVVFCDGDRYVHGSGARRWRSTGNRSVGHSRTRGLQEASHPLLF